MNQGVVVFIKRLFLFIALLIVADNIIGYGLETIYFGQKKGQFAQTTFSIDSTTQDILIFGSSRAVRHYSPNVLSKALNMSCYNVGRDAQSLPYYAAMQEAIFTRYKPKMIIVDVNNWELAPGEAKYEKLSILLPYYRHHPELAPYLKQSGRWEGIKLLSRTYPYNSSIFILAYNFLFANKLIADEHGFAPLTGKMTSAMLDDYASRLKLNSRASAESDKIIDRKALNYYRKFLANTNTHKIKTYVVISPKVLKEPLDARNKLLKKIAQEYPNVKFIDFSDNKDYSMMYGKFADVFHLNNEGAEEFTRDLIPFLN